MFEEIRQFQLNDIKLVLIDDIGEMVYSQNCGEIYDYLMITNHTVNMLKEFKKSFIYCEIKFENFYIRAFSIKEYMAFYLKDKVFTFGEKKLIEKINEKIKNIIED
jgi:hypothetical protein